MKMVMEEGMEDGRGGEQGGGGWRGEQE